MAVLVVEEEEIDDVVGGVLGVLHSECPEIVVGSVHDFRESSALFGDPFAEAFLGRAVDLSTHAVETLESTEPPVAPVVGLLTDFLPVQFSFFFICEFFNFTIDVRDDDLIGQFLFLGTDVSSEQNSRCEYFHFQSFFLNYYNFHTCQTF